MSKVNKFGKMKPEVKAKFVEALKSGKYRKVEGHLREEHWLGGYCYCGGGVLMDLYAKEKKKGWDSLFPDWEEDLTKIPNKVLKWAGLPEVGQIHFTRKSNMMSVNDNSKEGDFSKVINYVEKYL